MVHRQGAFTRFTLPRHTTRVPSYEVDYFVDGEWAGHYHRHKKWIVNVFVAEESRGKGICQRMMAHAIKEAGRRILWIQAYRNNPAAIACYKKVGFVETKKSLREQKSLVTLTHSPGAAS